MDLGRIRWRSDEDDIERERIFVNNVGLGFEGQVGWEAYRLKLPLRGMPLYLVALLRVLGRLVNPPLAIRYDEETLPAEAKLLVSIGNGHTSGGGFKLNPRANPFELNVSTSSGDPCFTTSPSLSKSNVSPYMAARFTS